MTFALGNATGWAFLVPYKAPVDDVASLVSEAEALWKAEDRNAAPSQIGKSWGCIGVLFRPGSQPADLQQGWAAYFSRKLSKPIPPVDKNGALCIPWPTTALDAAPADTDVILAAVTKSERIPPSAQEVAYAWVEKGHEDYFLENVRHGIRTREDGLIWLKIKVRMPDWLTSGAHGEAIAILNKEEIQGRT